MLILFFTSFLHFVSSNEDIVVNTRVIGGRLARDNEFPNQVAVLMSDGGTCGGTIIANHWVLTAAHCMFDSFSSTTRNPQDITIVLNTIDLETNYKTIGVEEIIVHEGYRYGKSKENDIAMMRTNGSCITGDKVKTMKAMVPSNNMTSYVGKKVWTVGFGTDTPDGEIPSSQLKTVAIKVLNDSICEKEFPSGPKKFNKNLMICAGYLPGKKDSCRGDSGGPLIYKERSEMKNIHIHIILGLVSYGSSGDCAQKDKPAVYTKVASYAKWILEKEKQYNDVHGIEPDTTLADFIMKRIKYFFPDVEVEDLSD